jgi:hypothetical protein
MLDLKAGAQCVTGACDSKVGCQEDGSGGTACRDPYRERWIRQFQTAGALSAGIHAAYTQRLSALRKDILAQLSRADSACWADKCNKINYGNHFEAARKKCAEAARKKLAQMA